MGGCFRVLKSGVVLAVLWIGVSALAQPAPVYTDGQKVEVREGDSWSAASIVKKEGRKYLVHYEGADAANDEWVTGDRMRLPGTKPTTGPAGKPATTAPAKPAAAPFAVGDKVEFKWGGLWRKGSIVNKRGKWYFIQYEETANWREWVEPWRLRKPGSKEDNVGYATPNGMAKTGEGPPREDPGDAPAGDGAPTAQKEAVAKADAEKKAPLTATVVAGVREVAIGGDDAGAFAPDPQPKSSRPPGGQPIILAGASGEFFERAESLLFAGGEPAVAVVTFGDMRGPNRTNLRVQRLDLAAGHSLNASVIPVPVKATDVSADGKQLLAHSTGFDFGVSDRLDVWAIDGAEPKHVVSFIPYSDQQNTARDISWAKLLGADRIATLNDEGRLIVWDLQGKAQWAAHVDGRATPTLSGGGKYLAAAAGQTVAIVETQTGKTLRTIPSPSLFGAALAFSPDGKQLAASALDLLLVWDVDAGKLVYEISPVGARGQSLDWVGQGFVLLDGQYLVSLDKGIIGWRYERPAGGHEGVHGAFGGRFWYTAAQTGNKGKPVLASAVIPDPKVQAALAAVKVDEIMAIRPGVKVSLEANLSEPLQTKARDALKAALTANGVIVADDQPIKLIAASEDGKPREISYSNAMGPRFGPMAAAPTKMTVNDIISRLTLVGEDGQKLWERTATTTAPMFLNLKKDQSIEQAVADAMHPSEMFFTKARIPKFVPKATHPPGLGATQLTAQGAVGGTP